MSASRFIARLDDWCERRGERMNPIVVKETRQALKSRAFPATFLVMLLGCWLISAVMIADYGEDLYYAEAGDTFFAWYLGSLLAAICFVVPAGVFRSVVSEFEGQTFEMLAITTLSPRKVVFGKLKSASVQMGAYFASIAPFVCFSYMLEGVSIPGLVLALLIAYLAGLSACMGAMMLGALAKQSAWQILCLLMAIVLGGISFGVGLGSGSAAARELAGWAGVGAICAGFGCFGYVFLFFSLLTLGVSIAQFTPTMPRPGQLGRVEHSRKSQKPRKVTPARTVTEPVGETPAATGESTAAAPPSVDSAPVDPQTVWIDAAEPPAGDATTPPS
jgi:hypothetical protein